MNWKGYVANHVTYLGLPALGCLLTWLALRSRRLADLSPRAWRRLSVGLFVASTVGVHLLVFGVFRYEGYGDLTRVWEPTARAFLAGHDPWWPLDNLYGPLYAHVLASGLWLAGGEYAPGIGIPFVAAAGGSLWLLLRIARRHMGEETARRLVLAVLLSPLVWYGAAVQTQDEMLVVLLLLLALDLTATGRHVGAVLVSVAGALLTKALFPLLVLPILLAPQDGWRRIGLRLGVAAALGIVCIGLALLAGWHPEMRAAPNVFGSSPWVLYFGLRGAPDGVFRAGLAITGVAAVGAAFVATRERSGEGLPDRAARGVVAVQAAFFLLSPFSTPAHIVHGLPFLAWQVIRHGGAATRAPALGLLLAAGLCLWQFPSLALKTELWHGHPALIVAFAAYWTWTGWLALRGGSSVGD